MEVLTLMIAALTLLAAPDWQKIGQRLRTLAVLAVAAVALLVLLLALGAVLDKYENSILRYQDRILSDEARWYVLGGLCALAVMLCMWEYSRKKRRPVPTRPLDLCDPGDYKIGWRED